MTFHARLTELIEKATKGPIIAYEDVQEAGKLKLFFSAIKDSNGENLVRASGAQSMSDFLLWAYLVNHAEAIRDLVAAAERIEPYLDAIICYASTMDEHEPNRVANNVRKALAKVNKP